MDIRPDFSDLKSYEEFKKYYWYREELSKICKQLNIDSTGTKQDLNNTIRHYFEGNLIEKKRTYVKKTIIQDITLDSTLLECGFSFNAKFRQIFSILTGIDHFKFTADMAAAWRKVKQEHNTAFTVQNMLDIYYHHSNYAKYDSSCCEWNQFYKDFCQDSRTSCYKNKLKAASIIWNQIRTSSMPKVYSYDLVQQYKNLLYEYI